MISAAPVHAKRLRFTSKRSFGQVREGLQRLVPPTTPAEAYPGAMQKAGGLNVAAFEAVVRSRTGESGFALFMEVDYSGWLPLYGIHRKLTRWIIGNPLIAVTLLRHDLDAALFAPVELLLREHESDGGSTVIYDLPSSLMMIRQDPPLLKAALVLDAKLETLVRKVTGC